jgi:hypothetical protein
VLREITDSGLKKIFCEKLWNKAFCSILISPLKLFGDNPMNMTMKQSLSFFLSLLLFLTISSTTSAKEAIPDTFSYAGKTMQLNGSGLRKKLFISLYQGSLYLTKKSRDANKIIDEDSPMAIRLKIMSSLISPKKMKQATLEGFEKSTGGKTTAIKPQIDALLKTFDKGVSNGDVYELINLPGSGVHVVRNGVRVTTIRSLAFKKALFGIWLSNHPVQASLKHKMLGL